MVVGATPSIWNFGSTSPRWPKSPIFNRYSLVAPQPQHLAKKSSINMNRKSSMRFPWHEPKGLLTQRACTRVYAHTSMHVHARTRTCTCVYVRSRTTLQLSALLKYMIIRLIYSISRDGGWRWRCRCSHILYFFDDDVIALAVDKNEQQWVCSMGLV